MRGSLEGLHAAAADDDAGSWMPHRETNRIDDFDVTSDRDKAATVDSDAWRTGVGFSTGTSVPKISRWCDDYFVIRHHGRPWREFDSKITTSHVCLVRSRQFSA